MMTFDSTSPTSTRWTLDDFDYPLPQGLIANYPLPQRDHSRMLVMDRHTGKLAHQHFYNLPQHLNAGDLLVLNNTKVLPSRMIGRRRGHTGTVEVFLLHPLAKTDIPAEHRWNCLMRPARKLSPGTVVEFENSSATLTVVERGEQGYGVVEICPETDQSVGEFMQAVGQMPIPPYLSRNAEELDKTAYQTTFAKVPGAQAAPTAGLHMTPEVLQALRNKGVGIAEVTLSVSAGTFRPVVDEDITRHTMDPEWYTVDEATAAQIMAARARGGRIVAVGTTVAKTLETVFRKHNGQILADSDWSRLFIYPPFEFGVVDALVTNFHLPKSTLMMLVSAFSNREQIMAAYAEAIAQHYRFYSYGDCMLIG